MSPRRIRVVAALIRDATAAERFLVQQRPEGKSLPLLWEFPGGKVEPGESDESALIRECREELGIELEVGPKRYMNVHEYAHGLVELVVYEAKIASGAPRCLEANEIRYATIDEMERLPFCDADIPLIGALREIPSPLTGQG
jgi:8-oxo-dGTP diphosphatase